MKKNTEINFLTGLLWIIFFSTQIYSQQFVFFDQEMTHNVSSYLQPNQQGPTNWESPVNYKDGTVYMRFEISEKPSSKKLAFQLCMWQDGYSKETCSNCTPFTGTGVIYKNCGTPTQWWKHGGGLNWSQPFYRVRIMIKHDGCGGNLMMSSRCGNHCYAGNDLADHVPIRVKATAVVVPQGEYLIVPQGWKCPADWNCTGALEVPVPYPAYSSNHNVKVIVNSKRNQIIQNIELYGTDFELIGINGKLYSPLTKTGVTQSVLTSSVNSSGIYFLRAKGVSGRCHKLVIP